jgi:hypothetical protein
MKQQIKNGIVTIATETKEESFELLNDYLIEIGIKPLSKKQMVLDIKGGETNEQLYGWATDLANRTLNNSLTIN